MNYLEGNKEFCNFLKNKGVHKSPYKTFLWMARNYFQNSEETIKERIKAMHKAGLIENDGQCWVLK